MAGAGGPETGVIVTCAGCGESVFQKAMIPILGDDGAMTYRCAPCARKLIELPQP